MDDATVEAIDTLAKRLAEAWGESDPEFHVDIWRFCAQVAMEHLPDPRPTEAEVRAAIVERQRDHYFDMVKADLRDLGCFRPEPATEED